MKTTAVTEEASAVSEHEDFGTGFLPEDAHYRLTGEMPAEKQDAPAVSKEKEEIELDEQDQPGKEEASAVSGEADIAAASAVASTQKTEEKKGPAQSRSPQTSESRWTKISRENKELRERTARLEAAATQRDNPQATTQTATAETKATAHAKPKIDDLDAKTGKPKYASYGEFDEAKDTWNRQEAIREFQKSSTESEGARQLAQAEQVIEKTVNERAATARKTYSDFDHVMSDAAAQKNEHGQDAFFYAKGSHLDGFFLDSDRGHDVMYAIAKDFEANKAIFARDAQGKYLMNPVRQIKELTKIESQLEPDSKAKSSSSTTSAATVTQAFRPPHQVSGKGTVAKDAVEQAVDDGDFETYQRTQNAKDLARFKRK